MRQVVLRNGEAVVDEVPAPALLPGSALVRVAYSCISAGTETATLTTSEVKMGVGLVRRALAQPEKVRQVVQSLRTRGFRATKAIVQSRLGFGSAVGYSCSGIVAEVADIDGLQPGDRVACAGAGYACHAEAVVVPENLLVHVPANLDLLPAATVTLGAIALQGVRRAQSTLGEIIGVIGLGLIGQLTVQLLKAAGCLVVALDVNARRVALARALGADEALVSGEESLEPRVLALTQGHGLDAVILTAATPSDEPVNLAMRLARRKGRVVAVGDVGLGLQRSEMYRKELDFLMSTSYGPGRYDALYEEGGVDYPYGYVRWTENRNMAAYLGLVAAGKIRLDSLLTTVHSLEDAAKAYEALRGPDAPLTAVLRVNAPLDRPLLRRVVLHGGSAPTGGVRVAVIGTGSFAQSVHLPNLQRLADRFVIRTIVSRTGTTATALARQYQAAVASTDWREALADPDVDAVLICTRHHLHASQAAEALRAGKHVFVEKPMALTREELADLTKTIEELSAAGRCPAFMVGFNRRFSPYAVRLRELVAGRRHPLLVHYRMNAGAIPADHWVHGPEGGGRIVGEACHILDLFRFLTGAPVERVEATAIRPQGSGARADDNFVATLRYQDGSVCTLLYTSLGPKELPKEALELYVDGRTALLDDYRALEVAGPKTAGLKTAVQDKGHAAELGAFHRLCTGQGEPCVRPEEMIEVTEASFTVREGVAQGSDPPPAS